MDTVRATCLSKPVSGTGKPIALPARLMAAGIHRPVRAMPQLTHADVSSIPNSDCTYSYFEEDGKAMVERFCFRRDLLVEKTRFALPAV